MYETGAILRGKKIGKKGWAGTVNYTYTPCNACGDHRWIESRKPIEPNYTGMCKSCYLRSAVGPKNPRWKGGRRDSGRGYVAVYVPRGSTYYPMAHKGLSHVPEHRLVMAKHLGRCLESYEIVHHINGVRTDNRLENLELIKGRERHAPYNILQAENKKLQARIEQLEHNEVSFNWLEASRYDKLKGQMRMRINALLSTAYAMHGYKEYSPGVTKEIMNIIEESWDIVRGEDKPLPEIDLGKWE